MIRTIAAEMQTLLTRQADKAAKDSGFARRRSPLGGAAFVRACVFACLADRLPTLDDFAAAAAAGGTPASPQAFDRRFTPAAADCLRRVLADAVSRVVASQAAAPALLARFSAVFVQDSTTVVLPDALAPLWRGCGGATEDNTRSALKLQVRLDLCSGTLTGPFPEHGRSADGRSPVQGDALPEGSLRVADMGYFDLEVFRNVGDGNAFWLSRLKAGTAVFAASGERLDLAVWLRAQGAGPIDARVLLGSGERLAARLVAVPVPEWVAEKRRARLRKEAADKGKKASPLRLALCGWTVLVTNLPPEKAGVEEVLVLARCRWQIELLFKAWKSDGGLDKSRSGKPYRVLCEVYAKLVALVVGHWLVVAGGWGSPRLSPRKATRAARRSALALAGALDDLAVLEAVLLAIVRALAAGSRAHKSKKDPRTWQLIQDPELIRAAFHLPPKS